MKKSFLPATIIALLAIVFFVFQQAAPVPSNPEKTSTEKTIVSYTLSDIAKHSTESDCWLAVNDSVYDVTLFISQHPNEDILKGCGKDATVLFEQVKKHQGRATNILADYLLAPLSK